MSDKKLNVFVFEQETSKKAKSDFLQCSDRHYGSMVIKDELENYYDIIKCNTIEIVRRRIGFGLYSVICDDEALLTPNSTVTMFDPKDSRYSVFGTVVIAGLPDDEGELTSLTSEDIENIESQINLGVIGGRSKNHTDRRFVPFILLNADAC